VCLHVMYYIDNRAFALTALHGGMRACVFDDREHGLREVGPDVLAHLLVQPLAHRCGVPRVPAARHDDDPVRSDGRHRAGGRKKSGRWQV